MWNKLPKEKKKALLLHWFYYYCKEAYTLDDLNKYRKLLNREYNKIYKSIILAYIVNETIESTYIKRHIESRSTKKLFDSMPDINNFSETEQKIYEIAELIVLEELVKTYNNPDDVMPLTPEAIAKELDDVKKGKKK